MVRRRINGGDVGLEDFLGRLAVAQKALSLHEEIDNVATNTLPAGDAPMPDQPLHQGDAMPISPMPAGDAEAPAAAGPSVGGPVASFLSAAGAIAAKVLAVSNPLAGALVGTLAPLVQDKLARELGRHTDRPEVAQQVAGALVQAAQHATGMDDPVDAVAAARRSPQAVAAVEASVLAELDKLSPLLDKLASYSAAEWAADEAGREAGSRRGAQPLDDLGRMLARAGLVLASTVVVAVFVFAAAQFIRAGKVDPEVWAAVMLVIGWATGKVSTLFDFRFGSSHGSAALDAARSTINRNRS